VVVIDCERRALPAADGSNEAEQVKHDTATRHFLFVDNVRFLALASIFAVQGVAVVAALMHTGSSAVPGWVSDALNVGTIAFFLMSGFLLGDGFQTARLGNYLRRRLKKVFLPWLFWFYLQVAYGVAQAISHGLRLSLNWSTVHAVSEIVRSNAATSAFWFIPNLFLAVMILLVFRRRLYSVWLGAMLLVVNLFYVATLYSGWMPGGHTQALYGFIFYVWLGAYAAQHDAAILQRLERVPLALLAAGVAATAAMSVAETLALRRFHLGGSVDTLRVSNQLFSVAVVVLLARVRVPISPRFVEVRRQMFGVYLTQTLVLSLLASGLGFIPGFSSLHSGGWFMAVWASVTTVAFLLCITASQLLAKHRSLGWMVGDHSMHHAERRAMAMIEERARELEAKAALERIAVVCAVKDPEREMDATLA
jgi:membrane-bound acyltransferase YfiQ involved in biofilm formation